MNRYKPVGWRYNSVKHGLAAKGIKTKYDAYKMTPYEESIIREAIEKNPRHELKLKKGVRHISVGRVSERAGAALQVGGDAIHPNPEIVDSADLVVGEQLFRKDGQQLLQDEKRKAILDEYLAHELTHASHHAKLGHGDMRVLSTSDKKISELNPWQVETVNDMFAEPTERLAYGETASKGNDNSRYVEHLNEVRKSYPEPMRKSDEETEKFKERLKSKLTLKELPDMWLEKDEYDLPERRMEADESIQANRMEI